MSNQTPEHPQADPPSNVASVNDEQLPVEAALVEIKRLHIEIYQVARMSLEKGVRIGQLLEEIRATKAHGQWLPWLKANVPFDQKTAWRYVNLFKKRDQIRNVPNLSQAYKLLTDEVPEPPQEDCAWPPLEDMKEGFNILASNPVALADFKAGLPFLSDWTDQEVLSTTYWLSCGKESYQRCLLRGEIGARRLGVYELITKHIESLRKDPCAKALVNRCDSAVALFALGHERSKNEEEMLDGLVGTIADGFRQRGIHPRFWLSN
jgi:hypothetical protein